MMMFKTSIILALFALVYGSGLQANTADKKTLDNVWNCIKSKMPAGVPEADFPTYDPWHVDYNFTFGAQILILKRFFTVRDVDFYDIPESKIIFTQTSKDNDPIASFEWSVHWPTMFINASWDSLVNFNGTDVTTTGLMNMSLANAFWEGTTKISKPLLSGNITELKITKLGVDNVEVGVTNFGEVEDFIFSKLFKYVWEYVLSSSWLGNLIQNGVRKSLQYDWIDQPDRLNALLEGCTI